MNYDPKRIESSLNLFFVLLGFQFFLLITVYFIDTNKFFNFQMQNDFVLKVIILTAGGIELFLIKVFDSIIFSDLKKNRDIGRKCSYYSKYHSAKLLSISAVNLFNAAGFLLSSDNTYILIYLIFLVLYFVNKPGNNKFEALLKKASSIK